MTKADIVNNLSSQTGLTGLESAQVFETILDTIKDALISGEEVKIAGFGTFNVRKKKARLGRNPKTKVEVMIAARKVVTFSVSDKVKDAVEGQK